MSIFTYSLMCYGLTALISLLVIAIALRVTRAMNETPQDDEE